MEGKKNKIEIRRNSEEGRDGREESMGEKGEDKDRGTVVEVR